MQSFQKSFHDKLNGLLQSKITIQCHVAQHDAAYRLADTLHRPLVGQETLFAQSFQHE